MQKVYKGSGWGDEESAIEARKRRGSGSRNRVNEEIRIRKRLREEKRVKREARLEKAMRKNLGI